MICKIKNIAGICFNKINSCQRKLTVDSSDSYYINREVIYKIDRITFMLSKSDLYRYDGYDYFRTISRKL